MPTPKFMNVVRFMLNLEWLDQDFEVNESVFEGLADR